MVLPERWNEDVFNFKITEGRFPSILLFSSHFSVKLKLTLANADESTQSKQEHQESLSSQLLISRSPTKTSASIALIAELLTRRLMGTSLPP